MDKSKLSYDVVKDSENNFWQQILATWLPMLVIVVLSYRQTTYAYPNGGGAFAVSMDNLGAPAALTQILAGQGRLEELRVSWQKILASNPAGHRAW